MLSQQTAVPSGTGAGPVLKQGPGDPALVLGGGGPVGIPWQAGGRAAPGKIVTPGTAAPAVVSIARSDTTAKLNVAPNTAIASWSPRSSSSARTIRGENCPIASCTATSVTVKTVVVSGTTAEAMVVKIDCASAALPTKLLGSSPA